MKTYRLITLVAAVLVNVLVARVLIVDDEPFVLELHVDHFGLLGFQAVST